MWPFLVCASVSHSIVTNTYMHLPLMLESYSLQSLYIFDGLFRSVQAAWTRRSRGKAAKRPNRESWKQRTDTHMSPFLLNVFFYMKFIHAKVMHRPTRKVISVATTNARNIRTNIP
ncbi:hypothetical protein YC2023_116872 [Brassica napus]